MLQEAVQSASPSSGSTAIVAAALASFLSAAAIGIKAWADTRKGRGRDEERKKRDQGQNDAFSRLEQKLDERFDRVEQQIDAVDKRVDTVDKSVTEVRSFCVGPDGKNGFRKDIEELKRTSELTGKEVGEVRAEMEKRERERLLREVHTLDRRSAVG